MVHELLVKVRAANAPGAWGPGDVVAIMPEGHNWGRGERDTSVFAIVKVDATREQLAEWEEEDVEVDARGKPVLDDDGDEIFLNPRRFQIKVADLPDADGEGIRTVARADLADLKTDRRTR